MIEELKKLRARYDFNTLKIYDDILMINKNWVSDFCDAYAKNGFKAKIIFQDRADTIAKNEDLFKQLVDVGLKLIIVGVESGSQRILDFLGKGTTVEDNYRTSQIAHKYDVTMVANFMLGVPTETKEDVDATVELFKRMAPVIPSGSFYTPYPGSYLYEYCKKFDLSLLDSFDDYTRDPTKPKIKGVDYAVASEGFDKIMGSSWGSQYLGRLIRIAYTKTRRLQRTRSVLIRGYQYFLNVRNMIAKPSGNRNTSEPVTASAREIVMGSEEAQAAVIELDKIITDFQGRGVSKAKQVMEKTTCS